MIRDYDGNKITAREQARQMLEMAVYGRMRTVLDDINDTFEHPDLTEKDKAEIRRHIEKYLIRMAKIVTQK